MGLEGHGGKTVTNTWSISFVFFFVFAYIIAMDYLSVRMKPLADHSGYTVEEGVCVRL